MEARLFAPDETRRRRRALAGTAGEVLNTHIDARQYAATIRMKVVPTTR